MSRKFFLSIFMLFVLLITVEVVSCDIAVGVKEGDWIEYSVVFTGTPPPGHEVTWARTEVIDVQGKVVILNVTTEFSDGTLFNESLTLNLETGQLGDDFIIPANLNLGDTFSDTVHGIVEITSEEEKSIVGALRTIVSATESGSTYFWDKNTGVLVEGISQFSEYTIHSIADKTNIWEPTAFVTPPAALYILLVAVVAILLLIAVLLNCRKKR